MSGPVRAFIALEIPEGVRSQIAAACDRVRPELPAARWTRPTGWHLTVKFLGDAQPDALAALTAALGPSVKGIGTVSARLYGSGFFPSPANPRVAWIGGDVVGATEVVAAVEEAAAGAGFARERRPWSLHLTLARLRSRWPRPAVDRFLQWGGGLNLDGFDCAELVLFESSLEPGGAVYTPLQRVPLV